MALIERSAAIDALDEIEAEVADGYGYQYAKWKEYFAKMPAVDAVPVVRCKNCVYSYYDEDFGKWWCNCGGCSSTKKDGFCHRGKPKDGKDDDNGRRTD